MYEKDSLTTDKINAKSLPFFHPLAHKLNKNLIPVFKSEFKYTSSTSRYGIFNLIDVNTLFIKITKMTFLGNC